MGRAAVTRSSRIGQVPGSVDLGELAQRLGVSGGGDLFGVVFDVEVRVTDEPVRITILSA
jgi:hypothetical protein